MRKIVFLLTLALIYCSCQKEETGTYKKLMLKDNVSFVATPGGAEMRYKLPNDESIFGVTVRYKDVRGKEITKVSGYGSGTLVIDGFDKAQTGIPIEIMLVDNKDNISEPIHMTFDTEDSAPYAFFDSAEVSPYWAGFQLTYSIEGAANGLAHVFYLGVNPQTHQNDTILIKSFPITKSYEPIVFQPKQKNDKNTVIVRTEDFRGNRVKERVWTDVESYSVMQMDPKNFEFDSRGLSVENEKEKVGVKYLFDGDLNGVARMQSKDYAETFTFLAGPNAEGQPMFIDMKEGQIPATIRMYGLLKTPKGFPSAWDEGVELGVIWQNEYADKLPCKVTVYGGNQKEGDDWTQLGQYEEPNVTLSVRWCHRCYTHENSLKTDYEVRDGKPAYLEVFLAAQSTEYRYLKVVVDQVFDRYYTQGTTNPNNFVSFNELEVYIKK